MNVLLLSMPDSFEHMPSIAIRLPNGALGSLAGNVDAHHNVAAADLILAQSHVRRTITRLMADHAPDVVGLSVMTFQRRTAQRVMRLIRALKPDVRIVVGGYDPTLAPDAYTDPADGVSGEQSAVSGDPPTQSCVALARRERLLPTASKRPTSTSRWPRNVTNWRSNRARATRCGS